MEAIEMLKGRRSIRKFTAEPVSDELLAKVVDSARYAPTWKNSQTARFIAVKSEELKTKIAENAVMGFDWNTNIIKGAAVLILLTTVDSVSGYEKDGTPSTSKGSHWQSFDAGLTAEAFCLAAHEAGLGTVILGIYDEAEVKKLAPVPAGQSVSALIALGHPVEVPASAPKRKEVSELLTIC